jgi:hypothetical protein
MGVAGTGEVLSTAAKEGIGYVETDDLRRAMLGASLGTQALRD